MRRYLFVLLAFAVASATTSCDSDVYYTVGGDDTSEQEVPHKLSAAEQGLVGMWSCTAYADESDPIYSHQEQTFHFWEDGKGFRTSYTYGDGGRVLGYSRCPYTWYIENEHLYIHMAHTDAPGEWDYTLCDNSLTLSVEELDEPIHIELTKCRPIDTKFMGDWDTVKVQGDKYINEHIQFVTPTDGFMYSFEYTDPSLPPTDTNVYPKDFRYEFDDNTITITWLVSGGVGGSVKKSYRIEGTKLYLDDVCYSNFKREQGFE